MNDYDSNCFFQGCTVLDVRCGLTKNNNPYTTLRFLHNCDVYDIFIFGDSAAVAAALIAGKTYDLYFQTSARRDGSLALKLVGYENV